MRTAVAARSSACDRGPRSAAACSATTPPAKAAPSTLRRGLRARTGRGLRVHRQRGRSARWRHPTGPPRAGSLSRCDLTCAATSALHRRWRWPASMAPDGLIYRPDCRFPRAQRGRLQRRRASGSRDGSAPTLRRCLIARNHSGGHWAAVRLSLLRPAQSRGWSPSAHSGRQSASKAARGGDRLLVKRRSSSVDRARIFLALQRSCRSVRSDHRRPSLCPDRLTWCSATPGGNWTGPAVRSGLPAP